MIFSVGLCKSMWYSIFGVVQSLLFLYDSLWYEILAFKMIFFPLIFLVVFFFFFVRMSLPQFFLNPPLFQLCQKWQQKIDSGDPLDPKFHPSKHLVALGLFLWEEFAHTHTHISSIIVQCRITLLPNITQTSAPKHTHSMQMGFVRPHAMTCLQESSPY